LALKEARGAEDQPLSIEDILFLEPLGGGDMASEDGEGVEVDPHRSEGGNGSLNSAGLVKTAESEEKVRREEGRRYIGSAVLPPPLLYVL